MAYGMKPRVSAQGLEMNGRRTDREDSSTKKLEEVSSDLGGFDLLATCGNNSSYS
jgi:hypothetical protein